MKKSFLPFFLTLALLLTWIAPISASAKTRKQETNETSISVNAKTVKQETNEKPVTIYNGIGEYVGEFKSIQDFQEKYLGINPYQRGVGTWLLTAATIYGVISMINDISYLFTGVDAKVWVRENVVVPFYESAKTVKLYSVSGGIDNPYPPHSYEYTIFNRTNYYWAVQ